MPHLEKPIDFSHVHPTGLLAYWPVSKARRDDLKLGRTSVGVYLGPAAMQQQAGHLVLTNTVVKQFLQGLVNELTTNPLQDMRDSTVDLAVHVLTDGTDGLRAGI